MKKRIAYAGLLVCGIVLLGGKSRSQPAMPGPPGPDARIRDRIETFRTWRLVEALDLSEEQSTSFFPLLKASDKREDALKAERASLARELGRLAADEKSSEKDLSDAMARYRDKDKELLDNHSRFYEEAAGVLTVRQRAQLLVFDEQFQECLRGMLQDIRHRRRGPLMPSE